MTLAGRKQTHTYSALQLCWTLFSKLHCTLSPGPPQKDGFPLSALNNSPVSKIPLNSTQKLLFSGVTHKLGKISSRKLSKERANKMHNNCSAGYYLSQNRENFARPETKQRTQNFFLQFFPLTSCGTTFCEPSHENWVERD